MGSRGVAPGLVHGANCGVGIGKDQEARAAPDGLLSEADPKGQENLAYLFLAR
jgi:hypothetical protein